MPFAWSAAAADTGSDAEGARGSGKVVDDISAPIVFGVAEDEPDSEDGAKDAVGDSLEKSGGVIEKSEAVITRRCGKGHGTGRKDGMDGLLRSLNVES